jgi:copper oxidase (laccase) domain-containing protein
MSIEFELETESESLKFQKQFIDLFKFNEKELKKNCTFKIYGHTRETEMERKFFSSSRNLLNQNSIKEYLL